MHSSIFSGLFQPLRRLHCSNTGHIRSLCGRLAATWGIWDPVEIESFLSVLILVMLWMFVRDFKDCRRLSVRPLIASTSIVHILLLKRSRKKVRRLFLPSQGIMQNKLSTEYWQLAVKPPGPPKSHRGMSASCCIPEGPSA